ncbi:MAG: hypothetical protein AAGD32_05480 [Planctomycetota bacterium]
MQETADMTEAELRREIERLREREQRYAQLIGCTDPTKLEHDLRNVLNELAMLRRIAELDDDD